MPFNFISRLHTKSIISILLILFSIQPLFAESDEIDRLILKGLDHCYHFRWNQGEETFSKIIKKYSDDPRGYHYMSTIYLWYYLSTDDKNDYENFLKYSNLVIDKAEAVLNNDPDDENSKYIMGTNYSCRMMIFTKAENYLDAIWASKTSQSLLNEVVKTNPKNYDAYLGLGLYNYAVDQIPSAFKWALNIAGISGSEVIGLQYIRNTADKGKFSVVEAQYYLSQILSEVKMDYGAAGKYLSKLAVKYPDNLLFNYSLGVLEIKKRNLKQAEKYISRVLKAENGKFKQLNAFSNFLMGDILFRQNEFDEAVKYYQSFLSAASGNDYTGIAAFRLGICFEMLNQRDEAVKYFEESSGGNTDLDDDIFAARKGSIYTAREMTRTEKGLLKFVNMIEAGLFEQSVDSLKQMLNNTLAEKIKAEIYLHLSEASFGSGKTEESIDYALQALELNPGEEKWIHPCAGYYAARGYNKLNQDELKKIYLDDAEDFTDYDYQNKLEHLIESLR